MKFNLVVLILTYMLIDISNGGIIDNEITPDLPETKCSNVDPELVQEIKSYQPVVNRIVDNIVHGKLSGIVYKRLAEMCDKFGPRMTGSQSLEDAIDHVAQQMEEDGLHTYTEEAVVPIWKRGFESAELIQPRNAKIAILGLGTSVGTPPEGITADAVVVESFEELHSLPDSEIAGKIVIYAQKYISYPKTVKYRTLGATEASKKGAVASLINSVTPKSLYTPHTGGQDYGENIKRIPSACITLEDASMLLRLYRAGHKIKIKLTMLDENLPDSKKRNLIGELVGKEKPNSSVVVVSGHIDSWDVGVGAMDDGGGAFIAWNAVSFLKQMNLIPKRTIRSILWTSEELQISGAHYYMQKHKANEVEEFNFFMESDMGTFEPTGLDFSGNEEAECIYREVVKLMTSLNATKFGSPVDAGPDISWWTNRGFPGSSLMNKNEKYFWYHHSSADSMLVEDPSNLDKGTALFAAAAYVIADLSVDMPKTIKNHDN